MRERHSAPDASVLMVYGRWVFARVGDDNGAPTNPIFMLAGSGSTEAEALVAALDAAP